MERQLGFLWQECPGGARLLKVYGDTPCPALPERIGGLPLREIGPYCFAEKPVPAGTLTLPAGMDAAQLHAVCGNFVESVTLPDSVHLLDSAAFYNCRSLRRVELGAGIDALGSDLFTNCRTLACLAVRAEPDATTGLRKLLGCVSADVTAEFLDESGRVTAQLFYPEYFELLDENTPPISSTTASRARATATGSAFPVGCSSLASTTPPSRRPAWGNRRTSCAASLWGGCGIRLRWMPPPAAFIPHIWRRICLTPAGR